MFECPGFVDRRSWLVMGSMAPLLAAKGANAASRSPAKSVILIWLSGGASHIDTWDMKPLAPAEYRGPFQPRPTTVPGLQLCEHLPHLASQARHLAVIRSVTDRGRGTGDHHAGYYYNLTGHAPDPSFHRLLNARTPYPTDWPAMSAVATAKRPPHPSLPSHITLPHKEGAPDYTRPGQFAALLGPRHDPLFVEGTRENPLDFAVPALSLRGDISVSRLMDRRGLAGALDREAFARELRATDPHEERAYQLLASQGTRSAFDLRREPQSVRDSYGPGINAMSMLLARRLVEAGVGFVTVFWKGDKELDKLCKSGGGWDTHGNNFNCLKDRLLPEFDKPFAALLADLHQRGLLESTLVMVSSEMGRKPRIGDPRSGGKTGAGRDHWTALMSVLMAGGGIRGGSVYGSSDPRAEFPLDKPVGPEDIARTVFHQLGIHDVTHTDREGRIVPLLDGGEVIEPIAG
jgi:hypothetical protein